MFNEYHQSSGILIYDPSRGDMKRRTSWWCVLNVDREITRYYRWWLSYERHIHTQPPAWDAHISVVRGEKPRPEYINAWKKYHKQKVNFLYKHGHIHVDRSQRTDVEAANAVSGNYYFIDVICPELDDIRVELGLRTGFKFHLTVARTYEYVARKRGR